MKQSICQICDLREDDDSYLVLFVCPVLNKERHNSWERVKNAMPPALVSDIDALLVSGKVKFYYHAGIKISHQNGLGFM